jgi:prepilin-type N-terminal cleavage/methylation domain-containing protein
LFLDYLVKQELPNMRMKARNRGFSMIELVIVIAIILLIAAVAIPNAMEGIYDIRLRSAGNNLAGLMQQARHFAIRNNSFYPIKSTTQGSQQMFFVDTSANRTSTTVAYDPTFPTVQLGSGIERTTTNPDTAGTSKPWGFTPLSSTPYWGPMGLPCQMSGGLCVTSTTGGSGTIAAYQVILTDNRPFGTPGFVSVTATPGGRVRVWRWSGGVWQ